MQKRTLNILYHIQGSFASILDDVLYFSDNKYAVQVCFKLFAFDKTLAAVPYYIRTVLIVCHLPQFVDTDIKVFSSFL